MTTDEASLGRLSHTVTARQFDSDVSSGSQSHRIVCIQCAVSHSGTWRRLSRELQRVPDTSSCGNLRRDHRSPGGVAILMAAFFGGAARAADLPFLKALPAPPPTGAFWIELDYLAWTVKGDHLPPLVTTSPAGTPLGVAGVLGAPGTTILFGNSAVNDDWCSGGRVSAGYWFDPGHTRGVEASSSRSRIRRGHSDDCGRDPDGTEQHRRLLAGALRCCA